MLIKDIAMFLPRGVISTILKVVRTDIGEEGKKQILKNGLYHITKDEETAKMIIESEYLKPSTGLLKNINSYGTAVVCMFNGMPTIENYMKNLDTTKSSNNPLLTPNMVLNAVKICPTEKNELNNYKTRALVDDVIVYEGYCVLPKEKAKFVNLVPDLLRDPKTNNPISNPETGKYEIVFREASENELNLDKKTYKAKEDYLKYVETVKKEIGYREENYMSDKTINAFITGMYQGRIEGNMVKKNVKKNIFRIIKDFIKKWKTPKLDMSTDEKIYKEIETFDHKKKNPYRDKKFAKSIAKFQNQGLEQLELKDELEEITTGKIGEFIREKSRQIDRKNINKSDYHNDRVALLSIIIAKNEGLLEVDGDNRTKDILLSSAYKYDEISGVGPYSRRTQKIDKKHLKYLNGQPYSEEDKNILQAIMKIFERKDISIDKICKKYHINEQDREYTRNLIQVLKDADDLDRVRLDINSGIMLTDLNPENLRTDTAKRLLNASYQLERLTGKVSFDKILAYKTEEQSEKSSARKYRESLNVQVEPIANSTEYSENDRRTTIRTTEEEML